MAAAVGTASPGRIGIKQEADENGGRLLQGCHVGRTSENSPGNELKKRDKPRLLGSRAANSNALVPVSHLRLIPLTNQASRVLAASPGALGA